MKFVLNYSPQAADLLQSGTIDIDRFKCPPWPDMIAAASAYRPVYIHFDLKAGPGLNGSVDWDTLAALRTQTNTPYVNLHLAPKPEHFIGMPITTTDPAHIAAVTGRMIEDVEQAVERFGADRVIVENVPYDPGTDFRVVRPAALPEVIRRVVEETGAGFLLDISHARISARSLGMDEYAYLEQMPCERLCELHMTGLGYNRQGHLTDHLPITEQDWPFLEWVLARIRSGLWAHPWALAFEYGGIGPIFEWRSESSVIAAQVPRLYALAHSV